MRFQDDTYWENILRTIVNRRHYENDTLAIGGAVAEVIDKLGAMVDMQKAAKGEMKNVGGDAKERNVS